MPAKELYYSPGRSDALDATTLRLFLAVIEERSMAKAAERECITTSAISKRISELESRVNVLLLDRSSTGVKPTIAGLGLAEDARRILSALDSAQGKLLQFASGEQGEVRIAANPTSMLGPLPLEIGEFAEHHPGVRIYLEERPSSAVAQAVMQGEIDIGVLMAHGHYPGLALRPYRDVRLVMIAKPDHPLSHRPRIRFLEASGWHFVLQAENSRIGRLLADAAATSGFDLDCRVRAATQEGIRRLVEAGLGLAVIPEDSARPYATLHGYHCIEIDEVWANLQTSICIKAEGLSASSRLMLDLLTHRTGSLAKQQP